MIENEELTEENASGDKNNKNVIIDGEEFVVIEGDLLLDIDEYEIYLEAQKVEKEVARLSSRFKDSSFSTLSRVNSSLFSEELVGTTTNGKINRWAPGSKLTYCVLKNTFLNQDEYSEIVDNMERATREWEEVCGVKFEYLSDFDDSNSTNPDGVLFPVRFINAGGRYIASAFFPTSPSHRRRVLIDPSYFNSTFNKVGILRHELGHVLGFRHEHIRSNAPPVCPHEVPAGTIDLTLYDPESVMHYFCGGVGNLELSLTDVDKRGAQRVYGMPLDRFEEISA